jgi:hypothetical protein
VTIDTPAQNEQTTPATEVSSEQLMTHFLKGKKLHDDFAEICNTRYYIKDRLISKWKEHFSLHIPSDANPRTCIEVAHQLLRLHEEASGYKTVASIKEEGLRETLKTKHSAEITRLVIDYQQKGKKLPAKDTLSSLADYTLQEERRALLHATLELNFWKDILASLGASRKSLENITINLGIEQKADNTHKYIERLSNGNAQQTPW